MTTADTPASAIDGEQRVQRRRLRRGADARDLGDRRLPGVVPAAGAGLHRADQAGAEPGGGQPGLDQVGRRRLAVGAGDAEDGQPAARLAVDPVGDGAEHGAGVVDDADRQPGRERGVRGRSGSVRTATAPRADGVGDVLDAVRAGAGQGGVQVAGARPRRRRA